MSCLARPHWRCGACGEAAWRLSELAVFFPLGGNGTELATWECIACQRSIVLGTGAQGALGHSAKAEEDTTKTKRNENMSKRAQAFNALMDLQAQDRARDAELERLRTQIQSIQDHAAGNADFETIVANALSSADQVSMAQEEQEAERVRQEKIAALKAELAGLEG